MLVRTYKLSYIMQSMNSREEIMLLRSWNYVALHILIVLLDLCVAEDSCSSRYKCVPPSACKKSGGGFLYPCNNGRYLCCPTDNDANKTTTTSSRFASFPKECGLLADRDKIIGGKNASIGQFPWMALLGYKSEGIDLVQFLCGGSLISENYVITAGHCLTNVKLELSIVRLGELDLSKDLDCEILFNQTVCAEPHVDIPINKTILHEDFNMTSIKNDIALVKLSSAVKFTIYVRPICLPFTANLALDENTKLFIAGWGKTRVDHLGGSSNLQYTTIKTWPKRRCEQVLTSNVKPLSESQFCGNGEKAEDACKGDSGGPVFKEAMADLDLRFFLLGIISFGSGQTCGAIELPTVYTRIESYLEWILDNAK